MAKLGKHEWRKLNEPPQPSTGQIRHNYALWLCDLCKTQRYAEVPLSPLANGCPGGPAEEPSPWQPEHSKSQQRSKVRGEPREVS